MGVSASTIKSAITMVITIPTTIVNANIFSFIFLHFLGKERLALTGSPVFHESKHGYMCKRFTRISGGRVEEKFAGDAEAGASRKALSRLYDAESLRGESLV